MKTPKQLVRLAAPLAVVAATALPPTAGAETVTVKLPDMTSDVLHRHALSTTYREKTDAFVDLILDAKSIDPMAVQQEVYHAVFGHAYTLGKSGFYATAPSGPVKEAAVAHVLSPEGDGAEVDGLVVLPVKTELPPSEYADLSGFVYAATFRSPWGKVEHFGFGATFDDGEQRAYAFVPVRTFSSNEVLTADDTARMFALMADGGKGDDAFLTTGVQPPAKTEPEVQVEDPCDREAFVACIEAALAEVLDRIDEIEESRRAEIRQVREAWAAGTLAGGIGAVVSGVVSGAITGAITGSPGGPAGAAVGAGVGLIAGGIGALIGGGSAAWVAQQLIDGIHEAHDQLICDAMSTYGDAMIACAQEHCPEIVDEIEEIVEEMLESVGCD